MTIKPFEPVPLLGLDVNTPASKTVHKIPPCSWLVKTTEQHVLLSLTFCAQLGKLYTSPRFCASCFRSLGESPHNPFRDDKTVAGFIREASANDSQILEDFNPPSQDFFNSFQSSLGCPYPVSTMNLQVRGYLQQHSLCDKRALTLDHWMIFRDVTPLYSSPLLVGRHAVRTAPSQSRFSLLSTSVDIQEPVIPPGF